MSKNPYGFTKSNGSREWGSKARKHEDHERGSRTKASREAVTTGLEELIPERIVLSEDAYDVFVSELEAPVQDIEGLAKFLHEDLFDDAWQAQFDDDPNPYHGDYSEC